MLLSDSPDAPSRGRSDERVGRPDLDSVDAAAWSTTGMGIIRKDMAAPGSTVIAISWAATRIQGRWPHPSGSRS
jgi:hypothetical protein